MSSSTFTLVLESYADISHDMRRFTFRRPAGLSFRPGQYGIFSFPGGSLSRPFTFASSPRDDMLEICVKKVGEFTTQLFSAHEGDQLYVKAPLGETLVFEGDEKEDIVMVAGGSGITPFLSMLRYARQAGLTNRFTLFYGNRTREDIPQLDVLGQGWWENLVIHHVLSDEDVEGYGRGHVTKDRLSGHVDGPTERRWYVCGPPAMNQSVTNALRDLGVPSGLIHEERWQLPGKHDE